ncbi:MAG: DUF89 family protein [Deltaproteobacteria bacterium]|nr:DUF89 family protein [Deltaproteobacteria bacterium]
MKLTPACAPCILDDIRGATERLGLDDAVRRQIGIAAQNYVVASGHSGAIPSTLITGVHRILKQITGDPLPFRELRDQCNEVGRVVAERVRAEAAGQTGVDRFRFLVRWAIAGNHLDFRTVGAGYAFGVDAIAEMLKRPFDEGLCVDACDAIYDAWNRARVILFIHDNVGEIAFDKLLVEEGVAAGKRVVVALRGGPITSDATMDDGVAVGLDRVASEVICAGPDTLGISWDEKSDALTDALKHADFIVAKGQANYYVFSEFAHELSAPIACLLRTKCDPVAAHFGATGHVNVATLLNARAANEAK